MIMAKDTYKCKYCDMRYASLFNKPYQKHLIKYHKNEMDDVSVINPNGASDLTNDRFKCAYCKNTYKSINSKAYETHLEVYHPHKLIIAKSSDSDEDCNINRINFFNEEEEDFDKNVEDILSTESSLSVDTYLNEIKQFSNQQQNNLTIMHLNVNSLHSKIHDIHQILKTQVFDIMFLNETKFDKFKPNSFYKNKNYTIIRRDRDYDDEFEGNRGGGIIIFIKKQYKHKFIISPEIEMICLNVTIGNIDINFVCAYKSPSKNNFQFLSSLETFMLTKDLSKPLFIVGDLNVDLLKQSDKYINDKGILLQEFLSNYNLKNAVAKATRIASYKNKINGEIRTSTSLIDVLLYNSDLIQKTSIIGCPFSDHHFVLASIKLKPTKNSTFSLICRNLSKDNMKIIQQAISEVDFNVILNIDNIEKKYEAFSKEILSIVDHYAPLKSIKQKDCVNQTPWVDLELSQLKNTRDSYYSKWSKACLTDKNSTDALKYHKEYVFSKAEYQYEYRHKMREFFETKTMKDFKTTKEFWNFSSSHVPIKSDKSTVFVPQCLLINNKEVNDPQLIANEFNFFFTNLSSTSNAESVSCVDYVTKTFSNIIRDSDKYIYNNFKLLKADNKLNTKTFGFKLIELRELLDCLKEISEKSSPGVAKIPMKIIKNSIKILGPVILNIFNSCIKENKIPDIFKYAECIPLHKKGSIVELNNYRGISILPPLAKLFEKLIAKQIRAYFESNNLFYSGQHGFRKNFSCETALHELISEINNNQASKLITILLFIDFRKAFDLVDTKLLLRKLFHYGFDNDSLELISNYFTNRKQHMKLGVNYSNEANINLGVPQGSVLGPLLFLIFINDLPFVVDLLSKLFADDTTFYKAGPDMNTLISNFNHQLEKLIEWCKFNRIDINFKKTYYMIITRKRIEIPKHILFNKIEIEVVDNFKLLGVTLDNKLTFSKYISITCGRVNSVMFSIKRLFYLPLSTKVQFFKSFILPLFDYCLTLSIYLSLIHI